MSLATVTFWGDLANSYGIPDTLHSYLVSVFTNEIFGNRDKIVKIIPLTVNSPKPSQERPFIVRTSTKEQAFSEAINLLKGMTTLKDLHCNINVMKSESSKLQFVSNF
jgi:hypothetical protein